VGEQAPPEAEVTGWLRAAGAKHVRRVHPRTPQEAEDPAVLDALRQAGGVWFSGGRQWRLVDALNDTAAERLLQEVMKRGGAVGGSAAGASILAAYLVRGNPLANQQMMAVGYEEGFGLLPGAAIDSYFTQRKRFADMAELKQAYPQLVGLGLDEGSAIVVKGHEFEVFGKNRVCVYARLEPAAGGERDYDVLSPGDRYNLRDRKLIGAERSNSETVEVAERQQTEDASAGSAETADAADPQPQPALVCE
jgi:cyanophycinase